MVQAHTYPWSWEMLGGHFLQRQTVLPGENCPSSPPPRLPDSPLLPAHTYGDTCRSLVSLQTLGACGKEGKAQRSPYGVLNSPKRMMYCFEVSGKDKVLRRERGPWSSVIFITAVWQGSVRRKAATFGTMLGDKQMQSLGPKWRTPQVCPGMNYSTEHEALPEVLIWLICFEIPNSKVHNCFGVCRYLNRWKPAADLGCLRMGWVRH